MLNKQSININFAQGLDLKTDPWQVDAGKFLALQNTVFNKGGKLQKRNGFGNLTALMDDSSTYLTTLNNNLTTIGNTVNAFSQGSDTWISKGSIQPMELSTLPLIRNNLNQTQCDAAVAPNNFVCTVYSELNNTTTTFKYAVADSITGQNIVAPTVLTGADATYGTPRVFLLGQYFIIIFTTHPSAYHLQFIAISYANPSIITAPADITASYQRQSGVSWDAVSFNGYLYIAFNTLSGGQAVKVVQLGTNLSLSGLSHTFAGSIASIMSLCVDSTLSNPIIYISWYDNVSDTGYTAEVDVNLNLVYAPTQIIPSGNIANLTSVAQNNQCTVFAEVINNYGYDASIPTNYIISGIVENGVTLGLNTNVVASVGLASKAFLINGIAYFLTAYQSAYQSTYFLINGTASTRLAPVIVGKLAYGNGGGYLNKGLPGVSVYGNIAQIAYLFKDLIEPVNKTTNVPSGTQIAGIYTQTGINLSTFTIGTQAIDSAEIGSDLHISGGFLWMYDAYLPVEHNFFVWPDSIEGTIGTSGSMAAQQYYYQVTYEWADNQGNVFRSAPSIPITVTTAGSGSVTLDIPTLRLTYKVPNPVKIVIYRWSAAQQVYYQVTSLTAPLMNDLSVDYVTYVDTLADATILGNNIIYTNGGVVEDVNAPASSILTLFDTRLWMVDAEDPNLLWFSKQVIEAVPVEMSDLLTYYIAPNTGTVGTTGPVTGLAPMDDKLVIFKNNAIFYVNGTGPDNTGSNSQYSQPIFVTSTVGCANQQSIVLSPSGLMFQSDKGIWILKRDLSTEYIGAPVEDFNDGVVNSAINVPATNQIRFTLSTNVTLMYDYYYNQWGTFVGCPAISSCIYNGLHTQLNQFGQVTQETPDLYLDGSNPTLIDLLTSWLKLDGLQAYQRAYFFYILGQYLSPHKLQVTVEYDYQEGPTQTSLISPDNFSPAYGIGVSQSPYGQGTPYGGPSNVESWRVNLKTQRCMSIRIGIKEVYDPSFGVSAGAGLTLSGINLVAGFKKSFRTIRAANQIG
jgi:hypothetical protein